RGDTQGDVTERFLIMLIPGFVVGGRLLSAIDKPLALGPKVGLHRGMPLLPVGASENRDHFVESAGHSEDSCWESTESASECDNGQVEKEEHLSANEGTSVNS